MKNVREYDDICICFKILNLLKPGWTFLTWPKSRNNDFITRIKGKNLLRFRFIWISITGNPANSRQLLLAYMPNNHHYCKAKPTLLFFSLIYFGLSSDFPLFMRLHSKHFLFLMLLKLVTWDFAVHLSFLVIKFYLMNGFLKKEIVWLCSTRVALLAYVFGL